MESRSKEVNIEIEFHVTDKEQLPETEQIFEDVKIFVVKEKAELLIENCVDNKELIIINAGGLNLKLPKTEFFRQVEFVKR